VALPDETTVGEPFWAIYETREGKNTGHPLGNLQGEPKVGFLFLSRAAATRYLEINSGLPADHWAVRGLPQRCLRSFILTIDCFRALPMIVAKGNENGTIEGAIWQRQLFLDEWYVGRTPISSEPLVAPGY